MTKQYAAISGKGCKKKVLLVDDHPVVRLGFSAIINQEADLMVCGEADDEDSALTATQRLQPDVAVVDWSLKDRDAAGLIAILRLRHPQLPILVLSMHEEHFFAKRAFLAGANGYVMKQESTDKIINAIHRVIAWEPYLTQRASRLNESDAPPQDPSAEIETTCAQEVGHHSLSGGTFGKLVERCGSRIVASSRHSLRVLNNK